MNRNSLIIGFVVVILFIGVYVYSSVPTGDGLTRGMSWWDKLVDSTTSASSMDYVVCNVGFGGNPFNVVGDDHYSVDCYTDRNCNFADRLVEQSMFSNFEGTIQLSDSDHVLDVKRVDISFLDVWVGGGEVYKLGGCTDEGRATIKIYNDQQALVFSKTTIVRSGRS